MKYVPGRFGMSAKLIVYVVDELVDSKNESPIPPELIISFMVNSRAKYVYDSFHSEERRRQYLKNKE